MNAARSSGVSRPRPAVTRSPISVLSIWRSGNGGWLTAASPLATVSRSSIDCAPAR